MDRQPLFESVISEFLNGALDQHAIVALLMRRLPSAGDGRHSDDLLSNCESALRHLGEWDERTTKEELRYYWECLRNKRVFDPAEVERIRKTPPQRTTVPLCPAVSAEIYAHEGYSGVVLGAKDASLTRQLEALQRAGEFKDLLKWFEARVTTLGAGPYYLVRSDRVSKFLREVRLFLELRFSEALGDGDGLTS